jgi:hypothetical protein
MLRSVLGAFLDGLEREAQLHQLLFHLLPEMGFKRVALLHGPREHGRDLIAQHQEEEIWRQFAFQAKLGDLRKRDVSDLLSQVVEAAGTACPHPYYDGTLPATVVVVTNGRVDKEGAALLSEAERGAIGRLGVRIETWGREELVALFEKQAAEPLLMRELADAAAVGEILTLTGKTARGQIKLHEIEEFSRRWCSDGPLFRPMLEAAVLREAARRAGGAYEALFANLAAARALAHAASQETPIITREWVDGACTEQRNSLRRDVEALLDQAEAALNSGHRLSSHLGVAGILTGPVVCHRWMDASILGYFLAESAEQERYAGILLRLIDAYPQATRPVSDKYAVTIFGTGAVLVASKKQDQALRYVRTVAKWLFDRYEEPRVGLGGVDDDPYAEAAQLLGFRFSGVKAHRRGCSMLLTALLDLAGLLNDQALYDDLVNDSLAVEVFAEAYVIPDSPSWCHLDPDDIEHIANLQVVEGGRADSSPHWTRPAAGGLPAWMRWAVAFLLRDRWFPARINDA